MEDAKSSLTVKVSVTDTELFLGMMDILTDLLNDERIKDIVKDNYESRIISVAEDSGYYLEGA